MDGGKTPASSDPLIGGGFVLVGEADLVWPSSEAVLVVQDREGDPFWTSAGGDAAAGGAHPAYPAMDDLIADFAGPVMGPQPMDAQEMHLGEFSTPADGLAADTQFSLVTIIVDDGAGGPFVA